MSSTGGLSALGPGPHGVISADREGRISAWNHTAEDVLDHLSADAIGQSLDLFVPEEERCDHSRNSRRAMANGVLNYRPDYVLDDEAIRRDGSRVRLDVALIGIHDIS